MLSHITILEQEILNGDVHRCVNASLRLQREWERFLVRRHEQNAALGRQRREANSRGGKLGAERRRKADPKSVIRLSKQADSNGEPPNSKTLAYRFDVTTRRINQIKQQERKKEA